MISDETACTRHVRELHQKEAVMTSNGQNAAMAGVVSPAPGDTMMQAIVQDTYGSADVLRLARIPTTGDRRRRGAPPVQAAGLDRGTWHLMTGRPYLLRLGFGLRGPKNPVPGRDVAGTVVRGRFGGHQVPRRR